MKQTTGKEQGRQLERERDGETPLHAPCHMSRWRLLPLEEPDTAHVALPVTLALFVSPSLSLRLCLPLYLNLYSISHSLSLARTASPCIPLSFALAPSVSLPHSRTESRSHTFSFLRSVPLSSSLAYLRFLSLSRSCALPLYVSLRLSASRLPDCLPPSFPSLSLTTSLSPSSSASRTSFCACFSADAAANCRACPIRNHCVHPCVCVRACVSPNVRNACWIQFGMC